MRLITPIRPDSPRLGPRPAPRQTTEPTPVGNAPIASGLPMGALLVGLVAIGCCAGGSARAADPDLNPSPDPGGMAFDPLKPPKTYSTVPTSPTDHFVNGKFDKTGTYIPPHYEAAAKPTFHGYFYKPKPKPKKDQFGNEILGKAPNEPGGGPTGN